jgi:hypothetical protein
MNAYSYAHNNPVTKSDPDGLRPDGPVGGASYNDDRWAADRGMKAGYTKKNGKWVWKQTPLKDKSSKKKYSAYRANPSTYKVYHYNAKAVAKAKAEAEAQAAKRAKAADEQRRKVDGISSQIKNGIAARWDSVTNAVTSKDWWTHKGVDIGVGFLATMGTAACIASVVCGGGVFIVGAAALFVTGVGAHMAVASEEERARGGSQYLTRTAKAEAKGMFFGATFGRGVFGILRNGGAKQGIAGPGLTSRGASDPLMAGVHYKQWGETLMNHIKKIL